MHIFIIVSAIFLDNKYSSFILYNQFKKSFGFHIILACLIILSVLINLIFRPSSLAHFENEQILEQSQFT